jgi:hypothetical protein
VAELQALPDLLESVLHLSPLFLREVLGVGILTLGVFEGGVEAISFNNENTHPRSPFMPQNIRSIYFLF